MKKHLNSAAWGRLVGALHRLHSAPPTDGPAKNWRTPLTPEQLDDLKRAGAVTGRDATELGRWWVSFLAAFADVVEGNAAASDSADLLHDIALALLAFSEENGAGPGGVAGGLDVPPSPAPAPVPVVPVIAQPATLPAATSALAPAAGVPSATIEESSGAASSGAATPGPGAREVAAAQPRVVVAAPTTSARADHDHPPSPSMPHALQSSQTPAVLPPMPGMPVPQVAQPAQPVLPPAGPTTVTSSLPADPSRDHTPPTMNEATGTPGHRHPAPNATRDGDSA